MVCQSQVAAGTDRKTYLGDYKDNLNFRETNIYKNILLITYGCGRGKTHYALNLGKDGLLARINEEVGFMPDLSNLKKWLKPIEPREVIFLTSRKTIKNQQLKKKENQDWVTPLNRNTITGGVNFNQENKIGIATAHLVGSAAREGLITLKPRLIILDEIHSLFAETTFAADLSAALKWVLDSGAIIVGLTATPEFLTDYVAAESSVKFAVVDGKELGSKYKIDTVKVLKHGVADTALKGLKIDKGHRALVYIQSAATCYNLTKKHPHSSFLISDYNKKEVRDEEGNKRLLADIMRETGHKDYMEEFHRLPDDVHVMFMNSAMREGLDLNDDRIKYIICESPELMTIQQVVGRNRADLETLYVVVNNNNKHYNEEAIKDYEDFFSQEDWREDLVRCGKRLNEQETLGKMNILYEYEGKVYQNHFARALMMYRADYYKMIEHEDQLTKIQIGGREIKRFKEYMRQLGKLTTSPIEFDYVVPQYIQDSNNKGIERFKQVEDKYCGRHLLQEDRDEIIEIISPTRSAGKPAKWPTVKKILENNGYVVKQFSLKGKQGSGILKP